MTIKTALLSLRALFTAAEPDDPQDAEVEEYEGRLIINFLFLILFLSFRLQNNIKQIEQNLKKLPNFGRKVMVVIIIINTYSYFHYNYFYDNYPYYY